MSNPSDFKSLLTWVLGGAVATTWVFGIYHAWQAHDMGQVGLALIPPYGVYMAAEQSFGHERRDSGKPRRLISDEQVQGLEAECRATEQSKGRLNPVQVDVFCECVVAMIVDGLPDYLARNPGARSVQVSDLGQLNRRATASCLSSAQYLGRPPVSPPAGEASQVPQTIEKTAPATN